MPSINQTTCCIVGGGPAGMMLGFLLAREGVSVTVLERHADFFRDFRGDTVHPSTLEVLHELGLLQDFLKVKHSQLSAVSGVFGDFEFTAADFTHLPTEAKFIALMPQWDFLNFLATRARQFPSFDLRMNHKVIDLVRQGDTVTGVEVETGEGKRERILAHLVVGCDGRQSLTREAAHLQVIETGVPIDVLWFRLPRTSNDPERLFGNFNYGRGLILINRDDYFQAGLIIRKNSLAEIQQEGIAAFRNTLVKIVPFLSGRVDELKSWDEIKLLSVQINHLTKWSRPGLLCIGDAAHAMSPVGGVGVNLAVQDAVAAANLLARPLREIRVTEALLAKVQHRREFPARATQRGQTAAHKMLRKIFASPGPLAAPWQLKAVTHIPGFQRIAARLVGLGVQPEHIAEEKKLSLPTKDKVRRAAIGIGMAAAYVAGGIQLYRLSRARPATPHH